MSTNATSYSIQLSGPVPPGACSRVVFDARFVTPDSIDIEFMPGDTDLNGTSEAPADVAELNGAITEGSTNLYRYDIDISGLVAPADILTEVYVLNGVNPGSVKQWADQTIVPCESAVPPG